MSHPIAPSFLPCPPGTLSQQDGAEDVACFMEALDLPPSFIVGASLGSSVAIHLAVLYPTLVLGLFLISPLSAWEVSQLAVRAEAVSCADCVLARSRSLLQPEHGQSALHLPLRTVPLLSTHTRSRMI